MITMLRRVRQSNTLSSDQAAWLWQHAAMGPAAGDVDDLVGRSVDEGIEWFVDPGSFGVVDPADPWAELDLSGYEPGAVGRGLSLSAIEAWLSSMVRAQRPLLEQMTWFWHGHLVSALSEVRDPALMVSQLRLFRRHALDGDLGTLLREVTVDPAMLVYLNGARSTGDAPNENFSRELLELFALGIGNYTEADVQAGARALTGWTIPRRGRFEGSAVFAPRRHDNTPQTYLGSDDVRDVDTVVGAVLAHPRCGPFVAAQVSRHLLGATVATSTTDEWGREFAAAGYAFRPLLRRVLRHGVDHHHELGREASGPVHWSMAALRALEIDQVGGGLVAALRNAGQLPMAPPNVAGWPRGDAWLTTTPSLARANLALQIAAAAPAQSRAVLAAERSDVAALAEVLGIADGFAPAALDAMALASSSRQLLATALMTDDAVRR